MSAASSSSVSGQPAASNVVATLTLALCAVALSAAVYWSNAGHASSPSGTRAQSKRGDESGRHGSGGASPDGTIVHSVVNEDVVSALRGGGLAGGVGGATSVRQALPVRNYFTRCAERHVRRHTANLVEWFDDYLGVHIPFSPILFAVQREERQAPLVLLSVRYLRQEEHRIAITIEETMRAETASHYMTASLDKVADCAQILSTGTTRIGSTHHPQAEYCYVDESNTLFYTLAVFVTHERLAITVQYTAGKRVSTIVPTAFSELIRSIRFTPPKMSTSYVLVSEPRLGFGLRLPLDFHISDSLSAAARHRLNGSSDRARSYPNGSGPNSAYAAGRPAHVLAEMFQQHTNSLTPARKGYVTGHGGAAGAELPAFMVATGSAARGVTVIASHESAAAIASAVGSGSGSTAPTAMPGALTTPPAGTANSGSGSVRWSLLLERHVHTAMTRLGLRTRSQTSSASAPGGAGSFVAPRLRTKDAMSPALDDGRDDTFTVRPYDVVASLGGNFANTEDDAATNSGVGAGGHSPSAMTLQGSFFVEQVYLTSDGLGALLLDLPSSPQASLVPVFWSCFYLGVGDDCVAVHFIAPCALCTFQSFVELSTSTMNSVSLGNHYGQGTAATYCSLRHDLLPFTLNLRIASNETVEEPLLGDPIAVLRTWLPQRDVPVTVLLRTFPVMRLQGSVSGTTTPSTRALGTRKGSNLTISTSSNGVTGSGAGGRTRGLPRRRSSARVLEHVVRTHLGQLPDAASICQWERTTVNGLPALRFCYEVGGFTGAPLTTTYTDDSNVDAASVATSEWLSSRALTLEEEVGSMNPLSTYYRPPPPPASYLGLYPATSPEDAATAASEATAHVRALGGTSGGHGPLVSLLGAAPSGGSVNGLLAESTAASRSAASSVASPISAQGRVKPDLVANGREKQDGTADVLDGDAGADEEALAPMRVAVALCYDSNQAMLFSASSETMCWREVSEAVLNLAARFTAAPAVDA